VLVAVCVVSSVSLEQWNIDLAARCVGLLHGLTADAASYPCPAFPGRAGLRMSWIRLRGARGGQRFAGATPLHDVWHLNQSRAENGANAGMLQLVDLGLAAPAPKVMMARPPTEAAS
jgi:hypothetical protein